MGFLNSIIGNAGSVSTEKLTSEYGNLLADSEQIQIGFKLVRDIFIFTDKRLILVDVQGMTGKKSEYLSILYKSISRFSIETAGHFDLDAELKIWVSGESTPSVSKRFNKQVNIYDVHKILVDHLV